MIKTKDGYAKLIGTTYSGSVSRVLLSNGGDHILGNSNGNIPLNNGTINTNLNADMLDGLHIHAGRNNEANKIVRTDASGYIQAGWINTTSGNIGTGTINKIYCSNDDYIRYKTPANFFPTLANSGNNISITVAGQNRTLTVGYATNADKVDGYHANMIYNAPSFTVNNSNTSNTYILLATITISGTSLACAEFTVLFQNRECLDSSSFILSGAIRRSSTTNVTATLSYITLHTKTPRNIYLRSDDGVTFMVYIQSATSTWTTYYRAIPIVDSRNITYSNTGTTSPISGSVLNITATKGGNVNYANSTGNADTLDNYHANGLLTTLSNSNNGISITVGGTTKSISNISVNYANSAGSASFATKVIVNQHTANDTNYPLVWSNQNNTNNVTENQLYKSWSDLYYNPKNKRLTVGGSVVAPSFIKSGGTSQQLLRADGGIATFNWSGQSGQPTWLWGGNNQHSYYVYNPSNFRVAYASSAGNADTVDGYHANSFLIDRGDNYKGLLYDLPCKSIFSGNNLSDAPTTGWVSGIVLGSNWNSSHYQHYLVEIDSRWYTTRIYSNSKMTNWNTFAYLTDNVASATKLQTPRTIWGQSFDGTGNISGSLSGVGHIQFSADNSYNIGTTTSEAAHTYTRQVWARHLNASRVYTGDTNLYIGYNNTAQVKFYSGTKQSGDGSNERMTISTNGNVGIGTTSPIYKLHVAGDIYTTTGFKKNGSSNSYVLLGGGGHKALSDFSMTHSHPYLPLSGGTMTGVIKSTFNSNTWINGVTNAVVKGEYTNYGAILSMPVKDGRVSISSYPSNDNYIYFGYATTAYINAGTNDLSKKMYWDAANNKLVADTFQGALQGNATTATTATKLSTSSAGSASLPVYFSNGIPVACTKSSIFSNLSNNGDQLSITVAGYNRLLTVAYASRADSAIDADYASSADWAEDSLHASSADSATNADYATNADTLDGHHAYEFALSGHTHTLKLESSTKNSSMNLVHGGKYELTAGNSSIIFTLPTDITSITFSGGLISSNSNTLTQANHSITIGGQTETAGYSTCNIINNLSINNLSSSSTTNLTAQITVNGVTSAQKTITQLHSRFWDVTRNSTTSNISPGNYSATITEVYGNASGITGNQPTDSWYHVYTAVGQDTKYATQLALGITTDGIWYRKYSNSSWGSWLTVLHSGNIGNYYWANISISSTRNTNTTPQFSKVMINTNTSLYQLNVKGDSHTTGWSRATNGFYCEGNDVYFTHNGTKGEIAVKNNNEFCWGSNSDKLYFNYTAPSNGTTVKNYIWNAGSSSTYASHTTGHITLGNSYYQLKRVGCSVSWSNGRNSAIVRQTTANGYSTVVSSKTTNGSWEMGNYTSNGDSLYFTYISDSNYNSGNNAFSGQIYFNSTGSIYANHFYESSDIRYKKILKNLSINSNTIANLPLFDFEWIENNAIGTGTSAQAVQQILPNLVSGTDKLTLDYGVLGTIAGITACKELVTQKSELQQLKEKVKQLEDKLRKYENI